MTYDIISTRKARKKIKVNCSEVLYKSLKRYTNMKQEILLVVSLNIAMEIIAIHIVTIGTVSRTLIHSREIFRQAIIDNASYIAIAHNHLSGTNYPSKNDLETTAQIKIASDIIGIDLIDSLIIGKYGYYSFRDNRLLKREHIKFRIVKCKKKEKQK